MEGLDFWGGLVSVVELRDLSTALMYLVGVVELRDLGDFVGWVGLPLTVGRVNDGGLRFCNAGEAAGACPFACTTFSTSSLVLKPLS